MSESAKFDEVSVSWWRNLLGRLWRVLVIRPVLNWQAWRCGRAKAYLLSHDYEYRSRYVDYETVRRRNDFYDNGGSPADPTLPDRWSVTDELRPMAWPRSNERG